MFEIACIFFQDTVELNQKFLFRLLKIIHLRNEFNK